MTFYASSYCFYFKECSVNCRSSQWCLSSPLFAWNIIFYLLTGEMSFLLAVYCWVLLFNWFSLYLLLEELSAFIFRVSHEMYRLILSLFFLLIVLNILCSFHILISFDDLMAHFIDNVYLF